MAENSMTLWRRVLTKHLKSNNTPDFIKNGVGHGANLYEDLESLIGFCRGDKKRQYSIGMVRCSERDVKKNTKSPDDSFKALHYIQLTEPYVHWQEAEQRYQNYYSTYQ